MAKPMTLAQLTKQFDKWGVKYRVRPGAETHRRDPEHGAWGPVYGLGIHHTGDDAPDTADENLLWVGRSDLAGPLCTWGQTDDGVAVIMSGGRSNHFGGGDPRVLEEVKSESYKKYPSPPRFHQGSPGATDGNVHFYGQETMYSGGHKMTDAAYKNTILCAAAVCDFHGWSAKSVIGHKEWSDWKSDPGFVDMADMRADVQAALDAGPGNWPTKPKPQPEPGFRLPQVDLTNVQHQFRVAAGLEKGEVTRLAGVRQIQRVLNQKYGLGLKENGIVDADTLNGWMQHEQATEGTGRSRIPDANSLKTLSQNFEVVQ